MNKLRNQFFLSLCFLLLSGYATVFAHAYEETVVRLSLEEPVVAEPLQDESILVLQTDPSGTAKENGVHEPLTIEEEQVETESDTDLFDGDLLDFDFLITPLFTRIPSFSFLVDWKPLSAETSVSCLYPHRPIYLILGVFRI